MQLDNNLSFDDLIALLDCPINVDKINNMVANSDLSYDVLANMMGYQSSSSAFYYLKGSIKNPAKSRIYPSLLLLNLHKNFTLSPKVSYTQYQTLFQPVTGKQDKAKALLEKARNETNYSFSVFSSFLGISSATLYRYLNGKSKIPDYIVLMVFLLNGEHPTHRLKIKKKIFSMG